MASDNPGLADYTKFLKLTKDEAAEIFRKSDKKQVWYNPDPKDKDTYASAEVISEAGDDTTLKTEQGDVCNQFPDHVSTQSIYIIHRTLPHKSLYSSMP